ncbi:hypothetical protein F2P81_019343 [Scophthalmus maximus]|uniref:Uncharacterized protein n=1 Tax=Scophthalmus maximus TaxID=52904 RepID=A0A6A4RZE1_SCOMX|nr:hypothetical protein F2P81_019343 [Scophthalmus maximus]
MCTFRASVLVRKRARVSRSPGDEDVIRGFASAPGSLFRFVSTPESDPLKLGADRTRAQEAAPCTGSVVHFQKPCGPRFTTSLLIKFSKTLSFDKPEVELKPKPDSYPRSFTEPQKRETEDSCCQVNRQTPPPDPPAETASDCPLPRTIPFLDTKEEEVISNGCNELETTRHLSVNHTLSNDDFGPHEYNGLHILPCRAQPKSTGSGPVEEDIKDHKKFENQRNLELANPAATMLSSTMVTVLAPHWSGRLRRTKRIEGTGNSESQGNLQDVSSTAANPAHEDTKNQHGAMRVFTGGSQPQVRAPFLGTRRNTEDWTTRSDPARVEFESKRKMIQTVSLDVTSGRMDNRKLDIGALSPVATNAPLLSPLSHHPDELKRNSKTMHQGALSTPSSKPTTSSMLLSLRKINSSGRSSNAASTFSDENPAPSDQEGNLLTTHLSQTFLNNSEQERSKSVLSPSSISYRTSETGPILSPSSCNYREMNTSGSRFFSTSPINKDTPFTRQPPTCSKQAFLSRVPSARQQSCRDSNKNTNQFPKSLIPSPRHSPYDHSALLKPHPLPRRTTLTSTSWWKQVTQEGSSPLPPSDTTNIKDQLNTPLAPPCNDSSALALPGPTDSKRFSSQINNNRDKNQTTESVCKGNMESQGGTHNLKQRNAKDSPEHKSDRLLKLQYGSCLNNKEPQKPLNLPDILSRSKICRATAQTTLSHSKDLSKGAVSNSSFIANVTELPPTFPNLKSSDTPTESSSKYNNDHCSSKTNSNLATPHSKDSEKFTQQSLSNTVSLKSQAPTSQTTSGPPLTPNTKTSSSCHFDTVSSQTNVHTSSTTGSSQTSKFTNTANATLLGFERSYASIPKHIQPKTVSCLISTVGASSKTNYNPVSTASVPSSSIGIHPVATAAPSPSLFTPPAALTITSSPTTINLSSLLTPPATPIITSPSFLETPSPKEGMRFSSSPERDQNKSRRVEGKRVRRVTWEDSVDLQCSESITDEKPEPSGVPTSPPSPSMSPRSVRSPSIFSFLRSGSPTTSTSALCSRISDQVRQDLTTTGQERTPSMESDTVQCHSSAPLSLTPDFSSGYKLRYSSPPYSTLKSSRSTQGEPKTITPRSPLFQQASQSVYTPLSLNADPSSAMTIPTSKPPLLHINPPQTLSLPFQNKVAIQESIKCEVSDTYQINNHSNNSNQDPQNGQILLIDNRVQISSQCLQGVKAHNPSSACVTETLVYSIKSKVNTVTTAPKNTTPKPVQHTANTGSVETKLSQQPHRLKSKEASSEPHSHSDQSSSGGSSADSQSQCEASCSRGSKESVLGKSTLFSVESSNEQSPKRNRFALKKSVSTPNSSLVRSDSERSNKTNNKMDQVINKLRQTFSTRRSDDDPSFPRKWKRVSQTPSVSGLSDINNVGDVTADCAKKLEERVQEGGVVIMDGDQVTEDTKRQNRYTIIPLPTVGNTRAGDKFSIWFEKSASETDQEEQNVCAGHKSESITQVHITPHSPTMHQFDNITDHKPTNQLSICRDPSPGRSPNPSGSYPTQLRKSTSSSRSPFSPFSSISPLSQFSSPDVTDDNVFYSPKPQRRREPSSPCEPGEGISLGGSRRSRASTGPPSAGPGQDNEHFASSYADLKYGIEPGRSFSVSSVLSSRPSGPGRISTGSRYMSVGDLSKSCLTCGGNAKDLDQWSFPPDWNAEYDCQHPGECCGSYFSTDPGKMRSKSLPRSLTRRLANWSSDVSLSQPGTTIASKPAHLWSPNMNTFHFGWDTDGPPTPPPTPPLSPVSRRMSTPPSISSPPFSSSPVAPHSVDTQSSRGHLPSRSYVSSLSTFDESTDSSSDTTTDDEYYLETGEGEEKETEL